MDRISSENQHQESEEVKEKAKIACLLIVQKFTDSDIFAEQQCNDFLINYVPRIKEDMGFKIKRFLLPALISISKQLKYSDFVKTIYSVFTSYIEDGVWGVRKAAIECTADII